MICMAAVSLSPQDIHVTEYCDTKLSCVIATCFTRDFARNFHILPETRISRTINSAT